jgi:DNA invertase Pin-like site-specific DNA recombinase
MTVIGYARIGRGCDPAPARTELASAGCTTIYCDDQVSLHSDWPEYDRALAAVPDGGILITCRLTHIGRSLEHLLGLLVLFEQRGVRLRVLREQLDTAEHGDLFRQATQGLIDAGKAWRSDATREGVAAAIAAGRRPGRPPGPALLTPDQEQLACDLRASGRSVCEIADLLGVPRGKLYRAWPSADPPTNGENSTP